jgi:four helix bundle protein
MPKSVKFRFEDFDIWKLAVDVTIPLFEIANHLVEIKKFRFSDQLDGAALSITNNILTP